MVDAKAGFVLNDGFSGKAAVHFGEQAAQDPTTGLSTQG